LPPPDAASEAWRVAFVEAVTAFHDPLSITIDDPLHSFDEERFLLIGLSRANRLLVIAHRDDGDDIRIISEPP
jgi:uncharacterized protein